MVCPVDRDRHVGSGGDRQERARAGRLCGFDRRRRGGHRRPTLLETRLVLQSLLDGGADRYVDDIVTNSSVRVVDFTIGHYRLAAAAFLKYGRGQGHPAKLNFGDCMSYAVAKLADAPLLYKGRDFTHTDIRPAYLP